MRNIIIKTTDLISLELHVVGGEMLTRKELEKLWKINCAIFTMMLVIDVKIGDVSSFDGVVEYLSSS